MGYDLQVRAVNANGDGPWSSTFAATTTDHSDFTTSATTLSLGGSVAGRIQPADDRDLFKIVLSADADLWVYTSGPTDTLGQLLDAGGAVLTSRDDGNFLNQYRNFDIRREVTAGTYYVRVRTFEGWLPGSYTIHARAVTDPGSTLATATAVSLDSATPGRIGPRGGTDGDKDVFRLDLASDASIWVMGIGGSDEVVLDTVGELLDSDGEVLATNDDSRWQSLRSAFLLNATLEAGTYYIRVRTFQSLFPPTGPYTLHVRTVTEPASSAASATPLTLFHPGTGNISTTDDEDYFSLTVSEFTFLELHAYGFGGADAPAPDDP